MFARAERRLAVAAIVAVGALALPATPVGALHQACGAKYPKGTVSTGHPDMTGAERLRGWAGTRALYLRDVEIAGVAAAKGAVTASGAISKAVGELGEEVRDVIHDAADPAGVHHAVAKAAEIPATAMKIAAGVLYGVGLAFSVTETALLAVQFETTSDTASENACNGTLGGDMVDNLWIAMVQRNLASERAPLAMLLVPGGDGEHEGKPSWPLRPSHEAADFAWCPEVGNSKDCAPQYHTGFLNVPDYGVVAVVEMTIAHAREHGVKDQSFLDQASACLTQAKSHITADRYKAAFADLRVAYRWAVGLAIPGTSCTGGEH